MPALELEGKLLVVDAQQVQDGGLKVMNVNLVVHGVEADIIRGSIGDAGFDAASSHPGGEGVGVVVAAPAFAVLHVALEERRAAEFTTPDDKGLIEHAALFEVSDETGTGLVGVPALGVKLSGERTVLVPARVHELDELSSPFGKATGEEGVTGEGARFVDAGSVEVEDFLWFVRDIGKFRYAGLHAIGHFVLRNTGCDFGVAVILMLHLIEAADVVEEFTPHGFTHPVGIGEVEHRIGGGAKLYALVASRQEPGAPVEVVEDLSAGGSFADRGHHHESGKVVVHGAQSIAEPRPHRRSPWQLCAAHEKRDAWGMVHRIGMHTLYETDLVRYPADVGHEVADPCSALAVLLERFNWSQEELAVSITGHGAKAFAADVTLWHRGVVEFLEFGFVVPEVAVGGRAVLKEVNNALGLRGDLADVVGNFFVALRGGREALLAEESREGGSADTGSALSKEMAAVDVELVLGKRIHRRWIG